MAGSSLDSITPFLTIWTRPRATIRRIVDSDPTRQVLLLAATWYAFITLCAQRALEAMPPKNLHPRDYLLSGLLAQWLLAIYNPAGIWASRSIKVAVLVALGALFGIVLLYLSGAVLKWTGRLLGGSATSLEVRAAIAWGQIPIIAAAVCLLCSFLVNSPGPRATLPYMLLLTAYAVLIIWGFVALIKCVGEVHHFSGWRALGAVTLWIWSIPLSLLIILLASHWLAGAAQIAIKS